MLNSNEHEKRFIPLRSEQFCTQQIDIEDFVLLT